MSRGAQSKTCVLIITAGVLVACSSNTRLQRMNREAPAPRPRADDRVQLDEQMKLTIVRFGKCTATHVGRGYFLTAGHCVREARGFEGRDSSPCPHPLAWGDDEGGACRVELYRFDDDHDYALLRLSNPELAEDLPLAPIDYQFSWKKVRRRPLTVAGYSKGTAQVDQTCNGRVATGNLVKHDCTTEPGDSGSALVDKATQHVIGVHGGALNNGENYGSPVELIPWAESLCVAETASKPIPIVSGERPVTFKVSTSHKGGAFGQIAMTLSGTMQTRQLDIRIFHPLGELEVDTSTAVEWNGNDWVWNDMYLLAGDDERVEGPWSVEISSRGKGGKGTKGYVQGRVLVCP
ncbi:MAG: serine protease [Deltaproteobacteria bacterium]